MTLQQVHKLAIQKRAEKGKINIFMLCGVLTIIINNNYHWWNNNPLLINKKNKMWERWCRWMIIRTHDAHCTSRDFLYMRGEIRRHASWMLTMKIESLSQMSLQNRINVSFSWETTWYVYQKKRILFTQTRKYCLNENYNTHQTYPKTIMVSIQQSRISTVW